MSRPLSADPVERAYQEGKFPESRIPHWTKMMAKSPKKTERVLASLEAALEPPETKARRELVEGSGSYENAAQAAPAGPTASGPAGPTAYPKEWLGAAAGAQPDQGSGHSPITMENPIVAAQCMPGANVPEGLG